MDGPSVHCAYLGFSAISKPPTNLSVLQNPIKELYFEYRKTPATGRSANLKLLHTGVLVTLFENGAVKAELFFEFSSVTFVEAAKFQPVRTSSERKPKAMFIPVDPSKGSLSDKSAFSLDKSLHFLVSSSHPPLVVCVVRRPTGVKALDCHVFALDTIESALHVSALIGSSHMTPGGVSRTDSNGDLARGRGSFDRGVRGDVIRTEHGEYSVYRGPQSYETQPYRYSGGPLPDPHAGERYGSGPLSELHSAPQYSGGIIQGVIRNDHMAPPSVGIPGPILLTQDIFREPPAQQSYGVVSAPKGFGIYEQPVYGGIPSGGYVTQHDAIIHAPQRLEDGAEHLPHDRRFSGSDHTAGSARMRYEEINIPNSNYPLPSVPVSEARVPSGPGTRFSAGQILPGGKTPVRPSEITPSFMAGPHRHSDPSPAPFGGLASPRSPPVFSPTSPRDFDVRDGSGPVFSASNLESRGKTSGPEPQEMRLGGKPVAKVPPHMKGIKVLPSDFRMVKLKPKTEKRSDTSDDTGHDNRELIEKYKELQEYERDSSFAGGMKISVAKTNDHNLDEFRDFSEQRKIRQVEHGRDFLSQWNDTVRESRAAEGGNQNMGSAVPFGEPREGDRDPHIRTKDLEIANMFSGMNLQSPDVYRQAGARSEIEQGLGYLP